MVFGRTVQEQQYRGNKMNNADKRYTEYVKNCKKQPRSFGDWLIITSQLEHHRDLIRPMIIWWQDLRKTEKLPNPKLR